MAGRKRKKQAQPPSAPTLPPPEQPAGAELLRRGLLGLIVALVVARPLILGEDPGMLSPSTDTSNILLSFLWMAVAVGWAWWRAWTRDGSWGWSWVEIGLLLTVVLMFVSASQAGYKRPAWLTGWEWLVFFLALFLARRLVTTAADQRLVLAAFLANAVSLSAFAIYQHQIAYPQQRERLRQWEQRLEDAQADIEKRDRAVGVLAGASALPVVALATEEDMAWLEEESLLFRERQEQVREAKQAVGTFSLSASFAGYLVLLLPAMALAGLAFARRRNGKRWVALLCLLLVGVALVLTFSRGAILMLPAFLVVGGCAFAWPWIKAHRKAVLLGGVVALIGAGVVLFLRSEDLTRPEGGVQGRLAIWSASVSMIGEHGWLGVGAGNFSRHYPGHKSPQAPTEVGGQHNFILEVWTTAGAFAVLTLMIAVIALARRRSEVDQLSEEAEEVPAKSSRWEVYVGGMAGLLFGYVMREMSLSPSQAMEPLHAGTREAFRTLVLVGSVRSLIWFASLALFEKVPWSPRLRGIALWTGAVGLFLYLLVSGGIGFPSVAQPLWVIVGMCLATVRPVAESRGSMGSAYLPLPLVGGFALAFLLYVLLPVVNNQKLQLQSAQAVRYYREKGKEELTTRRKRRLYLFDHVLRPLDQAVRDHGTGSSQVRIQLSHWYRTLWLSSLSVQPEPSRREAHEKRVEQYRLLSIVALGGARELDPRNPIPHRRLAEWHLLTAQLQPLTRSRILHQYKLGLTSLERAAALEPTNPQSHYDLAKMYHLLSYEAKRDESAKEALRLHELVPPEQRLTESQIAELTPFAEE